MDSLKQVDMLRERIIKDLLPDTCQIVPKSGANRQVAHGVLVSDAPTPRTWRGVTTIPCRLDLSRAFRPDRLKVQATEVDEYNAEFPFDVEIEPSNLIYTTDPHSGDTIVLEVRKRKNLSKFDGTVECIIAVPGVEMDAHS